MKKLALLFVLLSLTTCAVSKPIIDYKPVKPAEPSIVTNLKDWVQHCPECILRYVEKSPSQDVAEALLDMSEYIENLQDYFE